MSKSFCTFCFNSGKDKQECYGHYPGKDCPILNEIECSICNKKGHTRKYCNACKFCKSIDHQVNDCQKLKEKIENEKNAWCNFCEEDGHLTKNCNNSYNSKNIGQKY